MFCHETDYCLKLSLGDFEYENYFQWPYYKTESYDIHNLTMNSCNLHIKDKISERNINANSKSINVDKLGSITDVKGFDNDNWGIFEDCKYLDCSNSKCFSGKCNEEQELCEINDKKTGYICTLNKNIEKATYSIACLRMNHEFCTYHDECFSNVCDSQAKICVSKDSKLSLSKRITYFFKDNWYYIVIGFFVILILIGVVARINEYIKKSKKVVIAKMDY
ncbi:hypothetical protein PIROE2DRAFT_12160 [Piromyces sp. E2]|nr:hypothetical protein PIROE2DRAFT_12160 [Piromyces sp. E2]|eukprot:OUM61755.1 hypothetical protein PIROE2DRAFT_12160 [Piromyces sp. E2]